MKDTVPCGLSGQMGVFMPGPGVGCGCATVLRLLLPSVPRLEPPHRFHVFLFRLISDCRPLATPGRGASDDGRTPDA